MWYGHYISGQLASSRLSIVYAGQDNLLSGSEYVYIIYSAYIYCINIHIHFSMYHCLPLVAVLKSKCKDYAYSTSLMFPLYILGVVRKPLGGNLAIQISQSQQTGLEDDRQSRSQSSKWVLCQSKLYQGLRLRVAMMLKRM